MVHKSNKMDLVLHNAATIIITIMIAGCRINQRNPFDFARLVFFSFCYYLFVLFFSLPLFVLLCISRLGFMNCVVKCIPIDWFT